jgi:hypothetical protein
MLKTGFIPMKLRNHPISGDVALFASLIAMGKDLSSAESRTALTAGAFRSDSRLVQGQPPDGDGSHIEVVACAKLAVLPLPGL